MRALLWRRIALYALYNVCAAAAFGELAVRLFAPAQIFLPVANVYRPSPIAEVGYRFQPGFRGRAFGVALETNELGYRGPSWTRAKADGVFRIALVGDSHAFGFGVPFTDTVGEVLARRLGEGSGQKVEVLNFGVPGYNALQEEAVLGQLVWPFAPDLVLVLSCSNDHDPPLHVDESGYLHIGGVSEPYTRIDDHSLDHVLAAPGWLTRHSRLVLFARILLERRHLGRLAHEQHREHVEPRAWDWMGPVTDGPIPEDHLTRVLEPLRRMVKSARTRGTPIAIAALASAPEYRRLYHALAREEGVPLFELLKLFPEVRDWTQLSLLFGLGWDNHLNAVGHERWADGLARFLREQRLFSPG